MLPDPGRFNVRGGPRVVISETRFRFTKPNDAIRFITLQVIVTTHTAVCNVRCIFSCWQKDMTWLTDGHPPGAGT
jgi:hypothetical protein